MMNFECTYIFTVLYSMIILTSLRAHAIPKNAINGVNKSKVGVQKNNDVVVDNPLSFLDGFVIEDSGKPLKMDLTNRRISKRSVSSNLVPQYMMDMYEYLLDRKYKVKFDTARSFRSTGNSLKNLYFSDFEQTFVSRQLLFNISSFPVTEKVQFAQLRIQMQPQIPADKIGSELKIGIYSLKDGKSTAISISDAPLQENFLLSQDLTPFVQSAAESGKLELKLLVEISPPLLDSYFIWDTANEESPQLLLLSKVFSGTTEPEDSFLKRMKRSLFDSMDILQLGNVLNNKFHRRTDDGNQNTLSSRKKRSEDDDEETEEQSNYIVEDLGRMRKGKLKKKKNPCKRKPLHVNFADINYDQWIIAPVSYEAFECSGKCSFPMSAHLTPTKHAIIQTLMHSLEPKQISRACCVPTKLNSISVIYIEDDGVVTYKYDYEDMVVTECGCR